MFCGAGNKAEAFAQVLATAEAGMTAVEALHHDTFKAWEAEVKVLENE